MGNIVINLDSLEILEKIVSPFGTGAHVVISKDYLGKKVKVVIGKSEIVGKKIILDFLKSEILERKVSKFGTGCHVLIPKEHIGKKIKIMVEGGEDEN